MVGLRVALFHNERSYPWFALRSIEKCEAREKPYKLSPTAMANPAYRTERQQALALPVPLWRRRNMLTLGALPDVSETSGPRLRSASVLRSGLPEKMPELESGEAAQAFIEHLESQQQRRALDTIQSRAASERTVGLCFCFP